MAPSVITSFLQVMANPAFQDGKMKIPNKFVRKHGNEVSDMVRLSIPTGRCWDVRIKREANGEIWLRDGFSKFLEDNAVGLYYLLTFEHEGNSKFSVLIFELTANEIMYHCRGDSERCNVLNELQVVETSDEVDSLKRASGDEDSDDSSIVYLGSSIDCVLPQVFSSEPPQVTSKKEQNESVSYETTRAGRCHPTRKRRQIMEGGVDAKRSMSEASATNKFSRETKQSARAGGSEILPAEKTQMMVPNSFRVVIKPYHIHKALLRLPNEFAKAHLGYSMRHIKLVDADNNEWEVSCQYRQHGYMLRGGWYSFALDKELAKGDVCVFEWIGSDEDVRLKVNIERVSNLTSPAEKMSPMDPNSFLVALNHNHLTTGILRIPSNFAKAHLCCSTRLIKLVDSYNKEWEVLYGHQPYRHRQNTYILRKGWHGFLQDKGLRVRDICVFQRIGDDEDVKLKVDIRRRE